jgi:hypothetical protein
MTFLYSNIRSISKIHNFNIAMLSVCLSVCLSVAFKLLNRVTDWYQYGLNSMMLGGTRGHWAAHCLSLSMTAVFPHPRTISSPVTVIRCQTASVF